MTLELYKHLEPVMLPGCDRSMISRTDSRRGEIKLDLLLLCFDPLNYEVKGQVEGQVEGQMYQSLKFQLCQ